MVVLAPLLALLATAPPDLQVIGVVVSFQFQLPDHVAAGTIGQDV